MTEFIQNLIGNDYIATMIMSFIPLIELKGGIVFAQSTGMNFFLAFALAYVGSTIAFIPVYWLLRPILTLLKKFKWFYTFALKVESYFKRKADETMKQQTEKHGKSNINEKFIKQLGVLIFVAIPLPMTGVWTGTAIAVFLGLSFKDTILPVVIGNFIAGVIISLLSLLCSGIGVNLDYVLYALLGLAFILLIVTIIKIVKQKPDKEEEK